MYESRGYYSTKRRYTKKNKKVTYYNKPTNKNKNKKRKGSLVELDDNYFYQTALKKETPSSNTSEYTPEETEGNKENIFSYANHAESTNQCSDKMSYESESKDSNEPEQPSIESPSINLPNEALKEAYYFPKKLTTIYKYIYSQFQMQCGMNSQLYQQHCDSNNQIRRSSSNFIPNNSGCSVSPFSYYDNNVNSPFAPVHKKTFCQSSMNLKNIFIGNSYYDKDKTEEKDRENTDILSINIKVSKDECLVFKIRRYDDMFKTVKMFCEINHLDSSLIRPLIISIIKALNAIYGVINMEICQNEITFLNQFRAVA